MKLSKRVLINTRLNRVAMGKWWAQGFQDTHAHKDKLHAQNLLDCVHKYSKYKGMVCVYFGLDLIIFTVDCNIDP